MQCSKNSFKVHNTFNTAAKLAYALASGAMTMAPSGYQRHDWKPTSQEKPETMREFYREKINETMATKRVNLINDR